jgi:hypothetical protein
MCYDITIKKGVMSMPSLYKTTAKLTYTYTNVTITQFRLTGAIISIIADYFDPDFSIADLDLTYGLHEITATFSVFGYSYCNSLKDANTLMYNTIHDYSRIDMHIVDILTVPIVALSDIDDEWIDAIPFSEVLDKDGYPIESTCAELI